MFNIPPEDELQERIIDRKAYYVCKYEHNNGKGMWIRYKPEDYDFSKF